MFYKVLRFVLQIIFGILFRPKILGKENVPMTGGMIMAANHLSNWDPPMVGTYMPRPVAYMAKEELFVPVLGDIYRLLGAFPVRRGGADRAAIKHGIDILESNQVLAIFPEGTRSKTGELGKAQPGALMMASKVKAPIVPACIIGTDYKRHGRIWPKVTVRFGKPMPFHEDAVVNKEFLHAMTEELMQHIAKLQAGEKV